MFIGGPLGLAQAHQVELGGLAARQGLAAAGEQPAEVPLRRVVHGCGLDAHEGQHEHQVAGVDRLRLTVSGPYRGLAATVAVAVLQVVVDQAGVVEELAGTCPGDAAPRLSAQGGDGGQGEASPQSLSAGVEVLLDHGSEPVESRTGADLGHHLFSEIEGLGTVEQIERAVHAAPRRAERGDRNPAKWRVASRTRFSRSGASASPNMVTIAESTSTQGRSASSQASCWG